MGPPALTTWHRFAPGEARGMLPAFAGVQYGPDLPGEGELRLLGNLSDRRVLELGCGGGQELVAFARQGASAIGLDASREQLNAAQRLSDAEKVRVELHQGDPADLAFLRADSVDIVFSAYALADVDDLNRVFRQAHRILKQGGPLVFSLPHPVAGILSVPGTSYFGRRTLGDIFGGLTRAKFRVDAVVEPRPTAGGSRSRWWSDDYSRVPSTLIVRARKEGV